MDCIQPMSWSSFVPVNGIKIAKSISNARIVLIAK